MLRYLPVIIAVALAIYALIDLAGTPRNRVPGFSRLGWAFVIVIAPVLGPLAWIIARRPAPAGQHPDAPRAARRPMPPKGPEDDPAFLKRLDDEAWRLRQQRRRDAGEL